MKEIQGKIEVGDTVLLKEKWAGKPIIVTITRIQKDDESSGGWKLYCGGAFAFKRNSIAQVISKSLLSDVPNKL